MAEMLDRRRLGEGAFRAQKGGVERTFQRQTGGHDLAEEPRNLFAVEGPRIGVLDPAQHRDLAFRAVELDTLPLGPGLDVGDLLRTAGALADQPQQLLIDGIDPASNGGSVKFSGGPKGTEMNSYFIAPLPITKENLNVVIDAGWISKEEACQGVAAGSVAACN